MESTLENLLSKFKGKRLESYTLFENYKEEIIYLYKEIYIEKMIDNKFKFPHKFWYGEDGLLNARIIMDYIILEILHERIDNIPKFISKKWFRQYRLSGLENYHDSYIDLVRIIYPGKFNIGEFKILPNNIWYRPNKYDLAMELIRYNVDKCGYSIEDLYNIQYKKFFMRNNMSVMYVKLFNRDAVAALNCAFQGEHIFIKENMLWLHKWEDDNVCYNAISTVLKTTGKNIDELMANDVKYSKYGSIMADRFKTIQNVKDFYIEYENK